MAFISSDFPRDISPTKPIDRVSLFKLVKIPAIRSAFSGSIKACVRAQRSSKRKRKPMPVRQACLR
jgi:hypothetical protein